MPIAPERSPDFGMPGSAFAGANGGGAVYAGGNASAPMGGAPGGGWGMPSPQGGSPFPTGAPSTNRGPLGGLFDIFSTQPARDAANAQISGINAGYGQLGDLFGQGRNTLGQNVGAGIGSLDYWSGQGRGSLAGYGERGLGALGDLSGQGRGALTGATGAGIGSMMDIYGQGAGALTGYGNQALGYLGDVSQQGRGAFGGALGAGIGNTGTLFGQGRGDINTLYGQGAGQLAGNYAAGLSPYLQNYAQAQQGTGALGNALGLGGAAGNQAAMDAFKNNPGYQFQKQQGDSAILAAQAAGANGGLSSGNTLKALSDYNQGLAGTSWNNYVNQLQPYLGASNAAAGGIQQGFSGLGQGLAGLSTGQAGALNQNLQGQAGLQGGMYGQLGQGLLGSYGAQAGQGANITSGVGSQLYAGAQNLGNNVNQSYQNLGNQLLGSYGGQGAQTNQSLQGLGSQMLGSFGGQGSQTAGLYGGLGSQLMQNYMNQGNAAFGAGSSIGNANANADLARYNASGNIWGAGMNLARMFAGGGGGGGGGFGSGFGGWGNGFMPWGQGQGNARANQPALPGNWYAEGGRPPVGEPAIIGERGPELFVPDRAGTIVPNDRLAGDVVDMPQDISTWMRAIRAREHTRTPSGELMRPLPQPLPANVVPLAGRPRLSYADELMRFAA